MPPTTPLEDRYGRSQKKNIALAAWHAPFGGCTEEADLCRGQGFRRTAPPAPPRSQDRHVQGPSGPQSQERILSGPDLPDCGCVVGIDDPRPEFGQRVSKTVPGGEADGASP